MNIKNKHGISCCIYKKNLEKEQRTENNRTKQQGEGPNCRLWHFPTRNFIKKNSISK